MGTYGQKFAVGWLEANGSCNQDVDWSNTLRACDLDCSADNDGTWEKLVFKDTIE